MILTAYTIASIYGTWEGLDAWHLEGERLYLRRGRDVEAVNLPKAVIGLADNSPKHIAEPYPASKPTTGVPPDKHPTSMSQRLGRELTPARRQGRRP
jgi:hypothetical protein